MRITWRERLQQQPSLRTFNTWPMIPLDTLPRDRRKAFLRNQQIVAQALDLEPLKKVAKRFNLSEGRISQLLDRCLGGQAELPPVLTAGLVPYLTVTEKQRKHALPDQRKPGGNVCAFRQLLKSLPAVHEGLDAMIKAKLKDANYAQLLTPQALHGEFKRLLAESHWPTDHYPYTTSSIAYESVRRYLHQRISELHTEAQQRKKPPPRDLGIPSRRFRAMRAVQIDEHELNLKGRIHLVLNDELLPLRLARASVLVATDVDTRCILGFYLAPTAAPNQQDLLTLFENCLRPWQPLQLKTPGLKYLPGASFPSGLNEPFPLSFGTVQLDNALMHRALSIINLICEQYGATLSYGLPAMPEIRSLIESVFDYIDKRVGNRDPATTGLHPKDPKKESRKNQKKPPLISFETLNEALSIILTQYNVTPQPSLSHTSPLSLYQHQCRSRFVRYVPEALSQQWQPLIGEKEVVLHRNTHGKHIPHINFQYQRYFGPGLTKATANIKRIRVSFDRRDIRTLHAFTLSGDDLGELHVATPWQRFPHSIAIRNWIYKNAREYRFSAQDPLSDYFRYLLENKGKPAVALSLLRVYTEFTGGLNDVLTLGDTVKSSPLPQTYAWRTDLANQRG